MVPSARSDAPPIVPHAAAQAATSAAVYMTMAAAGIVMSLSRPSTAGASAVSSPKTEDNTAWTKFQMHEGAQRDQLRYTTSTTSATITSTTVARTAPTTNRLRRPLERDPKAARPRLTAANGSATKISSS